MSEDGFVEIPIYPESISFAAGPKNLKGLGMRFFRNEKMVRSTISLPEYLGRQCGHVHEGILSTMIDEAMAWSVLVFLRLNVFTKSLTINYLKSVPVMDELRIEARLQERTHEREAVVIGEIFNSSGELCVTSTGTFSLMTRDHVERLGLADEKEMHYCWDLFDSFAGYENRISERRGNS